MNRTEGKIERNLRFCPICGSTDVWWLGGLPYLAPHMECRRCGHRGVFISGNRELAEKIQEEYFREKAKNEG